MRLSALFLAALLTAVAADGAPAPRILVLGDSLSAAYGIEREAGWVAALARKLRREGYPHEVINASVSGETTAGGLTRLPPLLKRHEPDIVIIELGANDGLRGLPLATVQRNLGQLVSLVRSGGARPLLVGMRLPPNYGPRYAESFHAVYIGVARDQAVPLVPFLLDGVALEPGMMQGDGLHPTAQAQDRILRNVWTALSPLLGTGSAARAPVGHERRCAA